MATLSEMCHGVIFNVLNEYPIEWTRFELWPGSLCCVVGQHTFFSLHLQYLS